MKKLLPRKRNITISVLRRLKISNIEEKKLKQENDEMIADVVRDLFGEVNAENIESFKEKIQLLTGLEEEVDEGSQDNFSGDAGGIRSY